MSVYRENGLEGKQGTFGGVKRKTRSGIKKKEEKKILAPEVRCSKIRSSQIRSSKFQSSEAWKQGQERERKRTGKKRER